MVVNERKVRLMRTNKLSTKALTQEAEKNALAIRTAAGYGATEVVDDLVLAHRLGYSVLSSEELLTTANALLAERIRAIDARDWSAFAIPGANLIVYNANQTPERRRASILEEVAHLFLGHSPSTIENANRAGNHRTFDNEVEQIAYWTGAAVLVPAQVLSRAIWKKVPLARIAEDRQASDQLVEFRAKTLGLWKEVKHAKAA